MRATLHTDGAARRKSAQPTGPAGIGAVLRSESGEVIGKIAKFIGIRTNNEAEYIALIEGLQMALDCGVTDLEAYIDSPVVAGHLLKGHQVSGTFAEPSDGLEPSTPSLPCAPNGNRSQPAATIFAWFCGF